MWINKGDLFSLVAQNAQNCTFQKPQDKNYPRGGPGFPPIKGSSPLPIPIPTHKSATFKTRLSIETVAAYSMFFHLLFYFRENPVIYHIENYRTFKEAEVS